MEYVKIILLEGHNPLFVGICGVFREGALCHAPSWRSSIKEIRDRFKVNIYFLEITRHLRLRINKTEIDSK